jgi:hypothetical protein
MKLLRVFGVFVALLGILLAIVVAPTIYGPFDSELRAQGRPEWRVRELSTLSGRGAEIGVSVRDVELAEAEPQKSPAGVLVEDVRLDGPAEKRGQAFRHHRRVRREQVRSARQFGRLVQETAPGRTVKAVVVRGGQKRDVQITPESGRTARFTIDGDRMLERFGDDLGNLAERLPPFNFNFDFDTAGVGRRLGLTVNELTSQLAGYFGTNDGTAVTSVVDDSGGARG